MKNKKITAILMAFVIGCSLCTFSTETTKAETDGNLDAVVLLSDNLANEKVKDVIYENGGEVLDEIPQIGEIHVKGSSRLLLKLKETEGVESLSSNLTVKLKEESDYWKPSTNSYWNDNNSENSWWKGEDSNSYWGDNSSVPDDKTEDKPIEKPSEEEMKRFVLDEKQWDIKRVTEDGKSYELGTGNHDVVVGIIDSGVDIDHKDLTENFLGGENFVPENYLGDDTELGDKDDIDDRFGHGTNVTGFIAANGEMKGIAPNIGYRSYRIFDTYGNTDFFICADAVTKAVDDGVKVINLSIASFYIDGSYIYTDPYTGEVEDLGNNKEDYEVIKRAIDYAISNDVVVVTSSGNDGADCSDGAKLAEYFNEIDTDGFTYLGNMYQLPGSINGVITVSSTTADDELAYYSNYGKGLIDIAAPGGDYDKECFSTSNNGRYKNVAGTSFSAPKVSAAAALILCQDGSLTPKDVEKRLYDSADKISGEESESYFGSGILNVYKALKKLSTN